MVGLLLGCGADPDDSVVRISRMSAAEFDHRVDASPFPLAGPGFVDCGELPKRRGSLQPMGGEGEADPMECLRDAYDAGEPAVLLTRSHLGNGDGMAKYWLIEGPGRYRIVVRFFQPPVGDWPPGIYWSQTQCTSWDLSGEWPAVPILEDPDPCDVTEHAATIPLDYTAEEQADWRLVYRCTTKAENRQEDLRC